MILEIFSVVIMAQKENALPLRRCRLKYLVVKCL